MAKKDARGGKLYYLYYWNGNSCWELFSSGGRGNGEEKLKELGIPAMIALNCRHAEKVMCISLPETKKAPKKLPKKYGIKIQKSDFEGTDITLCRKSIPRI